MKISMVAKPTSLTTFALFPTTNMAITLEKRIKPPAKSPRRRKSLLLTASRKVLTATAVTLIF
ncbi:MAG: hypothetical protein BWY86_00815 [Candidatus Aminicenantes bacterium ADurb.Bin508]|nr:MAG: hypothetical protein BWY86_00815 [Candidatus Aminicenantes bacterium ADurb.Bin508]